MSVQQNTIKILLLRFPVAPRPFSTGTSGGTRLDTPTEEVFVQIFSTESCKGGLHSIRGVPEKQ